MKICPTVGNSELDDRSHGKDTQRCETCTQAEDEHDGEQYLAARRQKRHNVRRRKRKFSAEQMQTKFLGEEVNCVVRQPEETVPFRQPRSPERDGETKPQRPRGDRQRKPRNKLLPSFTN